MGDQRGREVRADHGEVPLAHERVVVVEGGAAHPGRGFVRHPGGQGSNEGHRARERLVAGGRLLRVEPAGPADQAGLQPNDELVSINLLPVEVFTLNQINRLLHSGDGRQLLLVVRRADGELHTATVRLKRQI